MSLSESLNSCQRESISFFYDNISKRNNFNTILNKPIKHFELTKYSYVKINS